MKKFVIVYSIACLLVYSTLAGLYTILEREATTIESDINIVETNI